MRIIHLTRRYWPQGGGVEYHLEKLNEHLVADGHCVSVITLANTPNVPMSESHNGVVILRIPKAPFFFSKRIWSAVPVIKKQWQKIHRWFYMIRLLSYLRKADVVQVHDVFWWLLPIYWLIPGKLYMTFHGYENELGPTASQQRWHQLAAALTDGSLAIGGFHKKWYKIDPNHTSYGAVDILEMNQSRHQDVKPHSQIHTQSDTYSDTIFKIIFIGRLESLTGAAELVYAVKSIPVELRQKIKVSMYGQGPLRDELQHICEEFHLPIHIHGYNKDARSQLKFADCAFVSQYLAILEALVAKKPVISYAGSAFKRAVLESMPYSKNSTIVDSTADLHKLLLQLAHAFSQKKEMPIQKVNSDTYEWALSQTWLKMTDTYYSLWKDV